jgi:UDP-GlcNAc:undecaprenyl-phosphate GlcNAc-1-phosphate transferase
LITRLSHRKEWYDTIDERKIHTGDVPRLGGIGFSLVFIVTCLVLAIAGEKNYFGFRFIPVSIGMFLTVAFGVIDDFRILSSRTKLLIQLIAGLLVILPGYTFHHLFFFGDNFWIFAWLRIPLSFLWIVGLTNAINFIDGVDGLAGGISAIIAMTYAVIFASFGDTALVTLFCVCLAAAIGGFLFFNLPFPKAKIFMGDGGSQFLGFTLALLPLLDQGNTRANLPLSYVGALLLIPIMDMVAAIWRRLREGRPIDSPDKAHVHHKLMFLGLSAWGIIRILYSLQIVLGILIFFAVKFHGRSKASLIFLGLAYLIAIAFFTAIHYLNRRKTRGARNGSGESVSENAS